MDVQCCRCLVLGDLSVECFGCAFGKDVLHPSNEVCFGGLASGDWTVGLGEFDRTTAGSAVVGVGPTDGHDVAASVGLERCDVVHFS